MGLVRPLHLLIVDDEPLARERMAALAVQCGASVLATLGDANAAMRWLEQHAVDVVLLDISMPGPSGMELALWMKQQALSAQLVFTTAHEHYAVDAFELDAADYLLKPVRLERLGQALDKVSRRIGKTNAPEPHFSVKHRDRLLSIPFSSVRYLKAELKYVSLVTEDECYLLDDSLVALEQRLGRTVLRIHRNCLVMRHALEALLRQGGADEESWAVRLRGIDQPLPVSRRQLAAIRSCLRG